MAKRKRKNVREWLPERAAPTTLTSYRLTALPTQDFLDLLARFFAKCDAAMVAYATGTYRPTRKALREAYGYGGALSFGWDWSTFGVLRPRINGIRRKLGEEWKRRGFPLTERKDRATA